MREGESSKQSIAGIFETPVFIGVIDRSDDHLERAGEGEGPKYHKTLLVGDITGQQ